MRAFAERVLPDGWALHVPEAMHAVDGLEDGSRGRTWWRMDRENLSRTPKGRLTPLELDDMDRSALQLEDELPPGPWSSAGSPKGASWRGNCSISMRVRGWRVSWRSGQGASARWIYDCD